MIKKMVTSCYNRHFYFFIFFVKGHAKHHGKQMNPALFLGRRRGEVGREGALTGYNMLTLKVDS